MESSSTLFEISIPRGALENKIMYLLKINIIISISHRPFLQLAQEAKYFGIFPALLSLLFK